MDNRKCICGPIQEVKDAPLHLPRLWVTLQRWQVGTYRNITYLLCVDMHLVSVAFMAKNKYLQVQF